jgi:hypothetical protein
VCARERERERGFTEIPIFIAFCTKRITLHGLSTVMEKSYCLTVTKIKFGKKEKEMQQLLFFHFKKCFISAFVDHKAKKGLNLDNKQSER